MPKRWLNARIYYSPLDMSAPGDPQSETILLEFVAPALRHMRERGWIEWATFMRFAESGYHVYLTVYGEEEVLTGSAAPHLRREFESFRAGHPEIMQSPMLLSPNAETLNRKWGDPARPRKLLDPGTFLVGLLPEEVDREGYESREAWAAHHRLHDALCARTLDLLRLDPSPPLRKQFVRLLMDDFLRLSGLAAAECYTVLRRLQSGWIDYFELRPELVEKIGRLYREKEERYQGFFGRKRLPEESLALLPEQLRPVYAGLLAALREHGPGIVRREGGRELTAFDAQRVIGVFHLMHNRLSVKLEDEILTAHILAQYYGSLVGPAARAEIDSALARRSQQTAPADAPAGG